MGRRAQYEEIEKDVKLLGKDLTNEEARLLIEYMEEIYMDKIEDLERENGSLSSEIDDLNQTIEHLEEQLEKKE